ncbi:uncharacterized protein LOC143237745 isoform X2 [Tachypleus tridentatus]|uniref:uncharacterized protein LOC143235184 isoform X2 n=1 Tax=Tachypleus tridentatus TaxID=6853 RepID=UPI003FD3E5C2
MNKDYLHTIVSNNIYVANLSNDDGTRVDSMNHRSRQVFPSVSNKKLYFRGAIRPSGDQLQKNHETPQNPENDRIRFNSGQPWSFESAIQKRGQACMKQCIAQRVLHPVQCYSLC